MEDQLTIRLPRELSVRLKRRAARMQRKPPEVVRMAVKEFLEIQDRSQGRPADRVTDLIGVLDSGIPDLAVDHRKYVLEKIRRGRTLIDK